MYHLSNSPECLHRCKFSYILRLWSSFLSFSSVSSSSSDSSCKKEAWSAFSCFLQPSAGAEHGPWWALSMSHMYLFCLFRRQNGVTLILIVLSRLSELRLRSPWLWAHLPAGGFERSWWRVPRHSVCASVWRDQLLWEPEWREPAAQFTWPLWR